MRNVHLEICGTRRIIELRQKFAGWVEELIRETNGAFHLELRAVRRAGFTDVIEHSHAEGRRILPLCVGREIDVEVAQIVLQDNTARRFLRKLTRLSLTIVAVALHHPPTAAENSEHDQDENDDLSALSFGSSAAHLHRTLKGARDADQSA